MGGFARRTSYWSAFAKKYPTKPFLKLDGGSVFSYGPAEAPILNRWMLEGTYRSNLDALNLSAWDVPVWQELGDLAKVGQIPAEWLKLPLVSANVKPNISGFPAVQRYLIKEIPIDSNTGKRVRIGITGLLFDPEERVSRSDFDVQDPEQAVRQVIEELKGKTDYRILLTDQTLGKAISLAVMVPGISLMLVSHDYAVAADPQQVGDTLLVVPVNEGRMINEVRLAADAASSNLRVEIRFVPLDRTVPDDSAMAELQHQALAQLSEFDKKNRESPNP
jgi:2',3'-cyclic-nucleotide 2'-phosphodiesterase (5'-nucleotidase family)